MPAVLLEQFGNGPITAEAINAATLALKKTLIDRAPSGEMNPSSRLPGWCCQACQRHEIRVSSASDANCRFIRGPRHAFG
jgi:hypothetical protein